MEPKRCTREVMHDDPCNGWMRPTCGGNLEA